MVNSLGLVCCPLSRCCCLARCSCCCNYKRYCCCLWFIVWSKRPGRFPFLYPLCHASSRFGLFRLLFLLNLHFAQRSFGGCVVHLEWAWCELCLEAILDTICPLSGSTLGSALSGRNWLLRRDAAQFNAPCHCSPKCFLSKQLGTRHGAAAWRAPRQHQPWDPAAINQHVDGTFECLLERPRSDLRQCDCKKWINSMHTSQGPQLVANCNSLSPRLETATAPAVPPTPFEAHSLPSSLDISLISQISWHFY